MRRALAIRLQATGDVVITHPYLASLRQGHADIRVDLLTREECADVPRAVDLFHRVYALGGGRNYKLQLLATLALLPRLLLERYEIVLDLQDSEISRFVRRALRPSVSCGFDRHAPLPAGERTRLAIESAGLGPLRLDPRVTLKNPSLGENLLRAAGWQPDAALVVLNPAGLDATRNWPLPRYVEFARAWERAFPRRTQFLILGLDSMRPRADYLRAELGERSIDLVGRTRPSEAFAILKKASLVLSEDSGLMHMAWVSGVPTLALFGSSRGDQSRPLGEHTLCLHSGDLECGFCMEPTCRFGDVHCLTRYDAAFVAEKALSLVAKNGCALKS